MARNTVPSPDTREIGDPDIPFVLSYFALRKAVGWIAFALPAVMVAFSLTAHEKILPSLSDYYYTPMREVFTAGMSAIGVFLLAAIGYEEDRKYSAAAGILAFGVSLFHCVPKDDVMKTLHLPDCTGLLFATSRIANAIHFASAIVLFVVLSYFCTTLFRKFDPSKPPTPEKYLRNRMYRTCGWTMRAALIVLALDLLIGRRGNAHHYFLGDHGIPLVEIVCMYAFGWAWLVKGAAWFADC